MPTAMSTNCQKEKLELGVAAHSYIPAFRRKGQDDCYMVKAIPRLPSKTLSQRKPDNK